jgi:diguanylate cyclase (GGDEF)-like protein
MSFPLKGTIRGFLERYPQRWTYPIAGFVLALGAPVGFFVMRSLYAGHIPSPMWIEVEARECAGAYLYLTLATATVFMILGRYLGREKDRLRGIALSDPLTGLKNRRFIQERAHALLVDAGWREPLSLLLVDLDGLKRINEEHGHAGGDRALCAVAAALRTVCRKGDAFARFGGDEFVVLLPGVRAEEALTIAGRICETMQRLPQKGDSALSVSIGVTDVERSGSNMLPGLLEAADQALSVAKRRGKNRAELSEAIPRARRA